MELHFRRNMLSAVCFVLRFPRRMFLLLPRRKIQLILVVILVILMTCVLRKMAPLFGERQTAGRTGRTGYLVETSSCKIVDIDPWEWSIRHLLKQSPPLTCNGAESPVRVEFDRIVVERDDVSCEYQPITRPLVADSDDYYEIGEPVRFERAVTVAQDTIKVNCYNSKRKLVHTSLHSIVRLDPTLQEKLQERRYQFLKEHASIDDRFNVILLAIDSTSRLNFIRQMPRTREYLLEQANVFELRGYTKVADNTFVNIVPLLTGRYVGELWNASMRNVPFDYFPLIWKNYSTAGYKTFYGCDQSTLSPFNYMKKGFSEQPTDHYLRPWVLAMEKYKVRSKTQPNCIGSKPEAHYFLEFLEELLQVEDDDNLFGLLFISRISHDDVNMLGGVDGLFEQFFRRLFKKHLLDNTFLFFFSDHGARFGLIRDSMVGNVEERLPFAFAIPPKRLLSDYPDMIANLRENQGRLVTPFDVHATIAQLLQFNGNVAKHGAHDRGISMFTVIPESRTCKDATVLPHWCACHKLKPVDTASSVVQEAAILLLQEVNKIVSMSSQCVVLRLQRVFNAVRIMRDPDLDNAAEELSSRGALWHHSKHITLFTVWIETMPGGAHFEGTIQIVKDRSNAVVGPISRTNEYGKTSHCVNNTLLKLYCYCAESVDQ